MAALPEEMDAIDPAEAGGPEVLVPVRRPVPRPGPGELLIEVAAAGVNRPDILQRRGLYPMPPARPPFRARSGGIVAANRRRRAAISSASRSRVLAGGGYAR